MVPITALASTRGHPAGCDHVDSQPHALELLAGCSGTWGHTAAREDPGLKAAPAWQPGRAWVPRRRARPPAPSCQPPSRPPVPTTPSSRFLCHLSPSHTPRGRPVSHPGSQSHTPGVGCSSEPQPLQASCKDMSLFALGCEVAGGAGSPDLARLLMQGKWRPRTEDLHPRTHGRAAAEPGPLSVSGIPASSQRNPPPPPRPASFCPQRRAALTGFWSSTVRAVLTNPPASWRREMGLGVCAAGTVGPLRPG